LSPGRVIVLRDGHFRCNLAVILRPAASPSGVPSRTKHYDVLALVSPETKTGDIDVDLEAIAPHWPPLPTELDGVLDTYDLKTVPLTSFAMVTSQAIKVEHEMILYGHRISHMKNAVNQLKDLQDKWMNSGSIPEVDWDSRMRSLDFQEHLRRRNDLVVRLPQYECNLCEHFANHYTVLHGEKVLRANIAYLKLAISDQNLELIPDYEQRINVLKDLKFIDENSTVLLKGRVACEINSAQELILTELILENTLASYEPEEVVALLSCFIFQEKTEVDPVIPPKLEQGRDAIIAIAERVERAQEQHKIPGEEFRGLKFGLVEVVFEWAKGMPFEQITELTDVAEGTIVRCINRLDETCREVRDAARVIGDAELFKKMEEAQTKIKRDIVFAASLYF